MSIPQSPRNRLEGPPTWLKSVLAALAGIACFHLLAAGNYDLRDATWIAAAMAALVYGFLCLLTTRTGNKNEQATVNRAERNVSFISIGIGLVILFMLLVTEPPDPSSRAAALGVTRPSQATGFVKTPTSTFTPTPTSTPVLEDLQVLIARFDTSAESDSQPDVAIKRVMEQELETLGETRIHVTLDATVLAGEAIDEAEALGNSHGANLVIWGEEGDEGLVVNYLNLRHSNSDAASERIEQLAYRQSADPSVYAQFVVPELPNQAPFLAHFALAQTYYLDDDYLTAIDELGQALEAAPSELTEPELSALHFRLGWLYQHPWVDDQDAAIASYDKALELDPNNSTLYNNRGMAFLLNWDGNAALEDFDQAIQLDPEYVRAYSNRGRAYYEQMELERALDEYEQAIQIDPEYAPIYYHRGLTHYELEHFEPALDDFNHAIKLYPDFAEAYYGRGNVYYVLEQWKPAEANYSRVIQIQPDYGDVYYWRGYVYMAQWEWDRAIADFDQIIRLYPDYAPGYFARGKAYLGQENWVQAIDDFDRAIEIEPEYALAYHRRSAAFYQWGELQLALEDIDKAIGLDPDEPTAYYNRAVIYADLGEMEQAIEDFDHAIELNPNNALAHFRRGEVYDALGQMARAIVDYERAAELNPSIAGASSALCLGKALNLQPDDALIYCNQAIDADPNPYVYDSRGIAHALSNNYEAAIADFQNVIRAVEEQNDPSNADFLAQRKGWVEALTSGVNPFTPDVLDELRYH